MRDCRFRDSNAILLIDSFSDRTTAHEAEAEVNEVRTHLGARRFDEENVILYELLWRADRPADGREAGEASPASSGALQDSLIDFDDLHYRKTPSGADNSASLIWK